MKIILCLFALLLSSLSLRAQCESITLYQEFQMTENIALVQGREIQKDSVIVEVLKKWKGDSNAKFIKFKNQEFNSEYFKLDTGKSYILFCWGILP